MLTVHEAEPWPSHGPQAALEEAAGALCHGSQLLPVAEVEEEAAHGAQVWLDEEEELELDSQPCQPEADEVVVLLEVDSQVFQVDEPEVVGGGAMLVVTTLMVLVVVGIMVVVVVVVVGHATLE